jgi:hypothetical protein
MVKHDNYSKNSIVNNTIDKSVDFMTLMRTIYEDLTVDMNFRRIFHIALEPYYHMELNHNTPRMLLNVIPNPSILGTNM